MVTIYSNASHARTRTSSEARRFNLVLLVRPIESLSPRVWAFVL